MKILAKCSGLSVSPSVYVKPTLCRSTTFRLSMRSRRQNIKYDADRKILKFKRVFTRFHDKGHLRGWEIFERSQDIFCSMVPLRDVSILFNYIKRAT